MGEPVPLEPAGDGTSNFPADRGAGVPHTGRAPGEHRASEEARSPATQPVDLDGDLLAGATIVTHDLSAPSDSHGPTGLTAAAGMASAAGDSARTGGAPHDPTQGGLTPEWRRMQIFGGGLLVVLCLGLSGWQFWRGRDPVAVTVQPLGAVGLGSAGSAGGAGSAAEIRVQVAGAVSSPGVYRLLLGDRAEDAVRAAGGFADDADRARVNLAQRVRDEQRLDVPFLPRTDAETAGQVGGAGEDASGAPPANGSIAGADTPGAKGRATATRPKATPKAGAARPAATARPDRTPRPSATPKPAATPRPDPTEKPSATLRPEPSARPSTTPKPEPTIRPSATARPERPPPTPQPAGLPDGKVDVNTATLSQLEALPGIGEVSARKILEYRQTHGTIRSLDELRQAGISDAILKRAADYLVFGS